MCLVCNSLSWNNVVKRYVDSVPCQPAAVPNTIFRDDLRFHTITDMAVEWLTMCCVYSGDTVSKFDRM